MDSKVKASSFLCSNSGDSGKQDGRLVSFASHTWTGDKSNKAGIFYIDELPFENDVKSKLYKMAELILIYGIACERIILFGSYARMEQTVHSDFDILVLSCEEVPREVRGELCSVFEEMGADLLFYTKQVFSSSETLLVKKVRSEGILLWKS